MKKFTQKLIAILLCVAMIGAWLPLGVHAEGTETEYTLYPTPHSVAYDEGSFELKDINALYGEGVDDYTKARLDETAALRGLTVTEAEAADSDKTNVYVAIYGSGDAVESYILESYTVDTTLFKKTDANFVAAKDGEIVVLGKDTDSCFYGLTTLYQIFGQLTESSLRNLTINDYADVASRGFIEGYYGNPWSTEDRAALMEWGGYYKLNSYFYAPKDDPKHNSKWRELYTEEELETLIRPLAEAGNASKCRFVFALHPYMYNPIDHSSEESYAEDLAVLQAKFEQVISVGVRQIAILADDAANVGSSNYIRLLEDMTAWLEEMREEYPDLKLLLPFVTQEYMSYGQSYYKNFPENVQIVMTGGQVWGYCSTYFTNSFYNNVGRGAYMWINWPCTDNSKNHLIMGGYADFLHPGVDPSKIEGIVLNPMQQSEPSKVAIFGNACYTWNIWETREEADAAWEASFSCVNHKSVVPNDASEAFKELCKHMINQNMTNGVVNLQESVDIQEELSTFKSKVSAGTYTQEEIDSLIEEFTILQNAAITFRSEGDQRLADQIVYWLDCWDDTTAAVISYLNALSAILNGEEDAVIWEHYATGQAAYESSTTHALWYMDHYEYAEVGVQHIVPFMKALHEYLSRYVLDIVDPSGGLSGGRLNMTAFEGGVVSNGYGEGGHYSGTLANLVDGDTSTYLWYDNNGQVDQYVGVDLGSVIAIENVTFTQDASDRFTNYEVQFSTDGVTYTTYGTYSDAVLRLELANEGINARYVRFYNLTQTNTWTKIYEIAVNTEAEPEQLTLSAFDGNVPGYYSGNVSKVVDGDTSSYVWYNNNGRVGQYIGVDLGEVVKIGKVTFTQDSGDHFSDYTLQYSTDGVTYTNYATYSDAVLDVDLSGDGIEARYIRFYNNASTSVWIKIYEIAVSEASPTCVMTNSAALASWNTRITADTAQLLTTGELTLAPGEYIGFDLGRIKDLAAITVEEQGELTLQVSPNMVDWTEVAAGDVDVDGRYVRLINLTEADVTVTLNTFTVTSTEYSGPYLYDSDIGVNSSWGVAEDCRHNGAAFDGDVTTITEFGDLPQEGQYIIYDLGREREIYKLEFYCTDGAVNYIRDAEMAISNDLENWTTVLTIGDGVENTNDANITCINSDAGYSQATSAYPNYVSIEGEVEPQTARYIRILMTATNNNRAVVFNEIEINDGEYVSVSNDPTFEITDIEVQGYPPQNMIDGDLTTSWKPDTTEAGSMVYTFSDKLTANRINIVQKTVSNAHVYVYAENEGQREWIDMGTLDKSLVTLECDNALNLALKIEWDADSIPNITEIVRYTYIPHEHAYQAVVTEPTCTEGGYTTYICSCGDSYVADETEALGHSYEAVVTEATCTEGGYTTHTCSRCGDSYVTDETEALGHSYEAVVTEATCTEGGYTTYTCTVCGDSYVADETDALGHDYTAMTVEATCTEGGYTVYTCTVCGHSFIGGETEALGHDYVSVVTEPTCTTVGYTTHTCSRCGDSYVDSYVEAKGHTYESVVTLPTCTRGGYTTHTCAFCADSYVDSYTAPLGHDWHGVHCSRCSAQRVNPFTDVPNDSFYIDAVLWAVEEGITTGATESTFDPDGALLRAQVVTMLWRAAGEPEPASTVNPFTDVAETDFYYKAVLWAVEKGITTGTSETTFNPLGVTNRAQAVTFLWRYLGEPAAAAASSFTDVEAGQWYEAAINWAVEAGVTNGMGDGTFGINTNCNRAHMVTFLYRALVK